MTKKTKEDRAREDEQTDRRIGVVTGASGRDGKMRRFAVCQTAINEWVEETARAGRMCNLGNKSTYREYAD